MMPTAPPRILDKPAMRYGGAIAMVALGLALRLLMVHLLRQSIPAYITFYPAVMAAAIMAGLWPGVMATLLSALVVDFVVLSPTGHFAILSPVDVTTTAFFVGMGLLMSWAAEHYRRSQRRLTDSAETQLELFVEYAPAALAMFDRDMRYLRASRRWLSDYGLGDRDLTGLSHYTVFPDAPEHWREAHRRGLAGEVLKSDADSCLRADGSTQWLRWEVRPWNDPSGGIGGILIFTEDITERKRTEAQLQQLARTYAVLSDINQTIVREKDQAAMLEAACRIAVDKGQFQMAWIGMTDPATQQVNIIASSEDEDGYTRSVGIDSTTSQALGGPAGRCLRSGNHVVCNDIENDPIYKRWKDQARQRGFRSSAAFPLTLQNNVVGTFVLYAAEPGFFDDRELILLDEMAMDISFAMEVAQQEQARRKVEGELRWRTAFFEAQMESSSDGIMVKDDKGDVIFRNRRFAEVWKMPDAIAQDPDASAQVQFALANVKDPEQLIRNTEAIHTHPDDTSQDEVELRDGTLLNRYTSPVKDSTGKYYGRLWVFQDITQRRQIEQQLRQSQKMEAVGQLTGGIAHDFNNLLGIILGNLDLLERLVAGNEPALRRVRTAQMASQRGADVTRRLLSFSRNNDLRPVPTQLHDSVRNVLGLARTLGPDLHFALQFDESVPVVRVDPSALENALLNLVVNARDAMPNGGIVSIATEVSTLDHTHPLVKVGEIKPGPYAAILVSDTGQGMSVETMERVFEPFFSTKLQGKGTGLGLPMVYGFVRQSGGAIRIYSELGHGTTVTVYLPLTHAISAQPSLAPPPLASGLPGVKVLVVDDEPELIEIAEAYLHAMGYTVFTAESPEAALDIAANQPGLHLLITDIIMPGRINGVELARRVRAQVPHIKVIYTSGYPADAMADRGLPVIDGKLLRKPYQRPDFEAAVTEAMA